MPGVTFIPPHCVRSERYRGACESVQPTASAPPGYACRGTDQRLMNVRPQANTPSATQIR